METDEKTFLRKKLKNADKAVVWNVYLQNRKEIKHWNVENQNTNMQTWIC